LSIEQAVLREAPLTSRARLAKRFPGWNLAAKSEIALKKKIQVLSNCEINP
jgi:hypothetical protein